MSELSQKLRFKDSTGATGECSLYTTIDECPFPNLKVMVGGTQAYAKLGNTGDSIATRVRVQAKDGNTYAVLKNGVPTGNFTFPNYSSTFTVPALIKVIYVNINNTYYKVNPNQSITITTNTYTQTQNIGHIPYTFKYRRIYLNGTKVYDNSGGKKGNFPSPTVTLSYSPSINARTDVSRQL